MRIRIREFKGDPDTALDRGDSLGNIDRLCSMTGKMKAKRQSANCLCQPQDAITDQQSRRAEVLAKYFVIFWEGRVYAPEQHRRARIGEKAGHGIVTSGQGGIDVTSINPVNSTPHRGAIALEIRHRRSVGRPNARG